MGVRCFREAWVFIRMSYCLVLIFRLGFVFMLLVFLKKEGFFRFFNGNRIKFRGIRLYSFFIMFFIYEVRL